MQNLTGMPFTKLIELAQTVGLTYHYEAGADQPLTIIDIHSAQRWTGNIDIRPTFERLIRERLYESDLLFKMESFHATVRIRVSKMPETHISERTLQTKDFKVSDYDESLTPRRTAEQECVAHCERLLTTGFFDFYRLAYKLEDGRSYYHNIVKDIV